MCIRDRSFTQFYGSIGKEDLSPLEQFAKPYKGRGSLPKPFKALAEQLLLGQAGFIEELYKTEAFQPYTVALEKPPVSSEQIFEMEKYLSGKPYKAAQLSGYQNRFGSYLSSLILNCERQEVVVDGLNLSDQGFLWQVEFSSSTVADKISEKLSKEKGVTVELKGKVLKVSASFSSSEDN